jgi:hypothetical protein
MNATIFRRFGGIVVCAVLQALPAAVLHAQQSTADEAPPASAAARAPTAAELEALEARYKAVLEELAAIERQQQAVEQLIARAEALESVRGTGSEAEPVRAPQQTPAAAPQAAPAQAPQQAAAAAPPTAPARAPQQAAAAAPQAARPAAAPSTQPSAPPQTAAAAPAPAAARAQTAQTARPAPQEVPVVAAERREEQEQATVPELPRVSSDVGGVLTPKGRVVVEPSMGYSYSSVSRVAIEGFTILPALLIGIIDIVEADRDTYLTSLSARLGLTNRLELELKSAYVYRNDSTRSREYLKDSVSDSVFKARGSGPGDAELGLRYQFKRRSATSPYLVGNLRFKAANGTDPFAIATQSQLSGEPVYSQELPTGSGFRSVSPSLTFIYPTDPVVFFGSIGYMWTEPEDKGTWLDADGNTVGFGVVDPGDALRTSFGLGLGLNDRSSMSLSYQLDKFSKTYIETASVQDIVGSDVTVGKLLVGYSLRLNNGAPLNLAIGIGPTGDAADTDLTFRMPFSFND